MANKFPFVFDKPFASEGDFVLPKFEADPKVANWPQGFSGRFSEPPEDGGLFIEREAMNGIHNALSQNQAWQQSGQLPTFDPAYVAKSGGYTRGAVLWNIPEIISEEISEETRVNASATSWLGIEHYYLTQTIVTRHPVAVMSIIDNNTDDFTADQRYIGQSWILLDPGVVIETGESVDNFVGQGITRYKKTISFIESTILLYSPVLISGFLSIRASVFYTFTIPGSGSNLIPLNTLFSPFASTKFNTGMARLEDSFVIQSAMATISSANNDLKHLFCPVLFKSSFNQGINKIESSGISFANVGDPIAGSASSISIKGYTRQLYSAELNRPYK